jgi:molybdate transport system ATP-binding protein
VLQLRRGSFALSVDVRCNGVVTGEFGHAGAGESSLLFAVAGLVEPDQGLIRVDGEVLLATSRGVRVAPHKRRVGAVFQDARLFPHDSVRGNLHRRA